MARCVAQFTAPSLCFRRYVQSEEYSKPRHSVKMMSSSQVPVLRIQSFSGLRPINALDLTARPDQYFLSMVNLSISSRKGRASRCVTKAVFERFTEEPIKVIVMAQEEARRLGHNLVGTEQILLGLIKEGTGITAKVFKSMGINLKDTRGEVEKIIGRGTGTVPEEIPFTRSGTHVVKLSLMEARQRGQKNVLSEHLLLSLLREGGGEAARVLENLGADPSNIRREVIRMIEEFQ